MTITKPEIMQTGASTFSLEVPSLRSRVIAHYKRRWWVHLILAIVIVLVVILPMVYVYYPKAAQDDVNESTLTITDMILSNPTPNSFHLKQTQIIGSNSRFHPHIFAFEAAVTLAGAAAPFAKVHVPPVQSANGAKFTVSELLHLNGSSTFSDYATAVMVDKVVTLDVYGRPVLQEGALPKTKVTYNKTVTMKGLNKFQGFNVTQFQILTPSNPNAPNMKGTVYIPNPSVMTIEMGNITLDLAVSNQQVGQAFLQNFTLKPGDNTVPLTAKLDVTAVTNLAINTGALFTGAVPFQISGNSCVYDGQNIPYFTRALEANSFTVRVNIGSMLSGGGG